MKSEAGNNNRIIVHIGYSALLVLREIRERLGEVTSAAFPVKAAKGNVSEILIFSFQGTAKDKNLPPHLLRK